MAHGVRLEPRDESMSEEGGEPHFDEGTCCPFFDAGRRVGYGLSESLDRIR